MGKISKIVIEMNGEDYEFAGGGTPDPNTVGTEQIVDDSVMMDDLNTEVKQKFTNTYKEDDESLILGN